MSLANTRSFYLPSRIPFVLPSCDYVVDVKKSGVFKLFATWMTEYVYHALAFLFILIL